MDTSRLGAERTAKPWRRRPHTWSIMSSHQCPRASGRSPCPSGCAASSPTAKARSQPSRGSSSLEKSDSGALRQASRVPPPHALIAVRPEVQAACQTDFCGRLLHPGPLGPCILTVRRQPLAAPPETNPEDPADFPTSDRPRGKLLLNYLQRRQQPRAVLKDRETTNRRIRHAAARLARRLHPPPTTKG